MRYDDNRKDLAGKFARGLADVLGPEGNEPDLFTSEVSMKALGYCLTVLGGVVSHPGAFIAAIAFTIAWVIVQPESFDWHGGVTIATLFMTLFIQRATHRDTQALHAKIDELIHTNAHARNSVANVDDKEPEEIEDHREQERK